MAAALAAAFAASTCSLSDLINPDSPGRLTIEPLSYLDTAFLGSTALRDVRIAVEGGVAADPLPFTVRSLHNSAWLKLIASTGAAPDTFVVQLDPAGLASGVYQDTLEFSSAGPGAPPIHVPVEVRKSHCRCHCWMGREFAPSPHRLR